MKKNMKFIKKSYLKGLLAEYFVAVFLFLKFYKILKLRYKTKVGEVDIVAKKKEMLVCVEVKYRKNIKNCYFSIDNKKILRVRNTALIIMRDYKCNRVRFDVVYVGFFKIKHLKNVF